MKKNNYKISNIAKFEYIFICSSILLFLFSYIFTNFNLMLVSILLLVLDNIFGSLFDIKKNIVLLVFNITFFTLLLGNYTVRMIFGENWYNDFDESIMKNTLLLMYMSLFSIWIGSKIYNLFNIKKEKCNLSKKDSTGIIYMRKILFLAFFITIIPALTVEIEEVIFVYKNSYVSLYNSFQSSLPFILQKLAVINPTFFLLYLATFPSKKKSIITTIAYMVVLVFSLLTGARGTIVTNLLLIFIYYIYRQFEFKEKYFTKKTIVFLGVVSVCFMVFLGAYNSIRNNKKIENMNPINQLKQFFIDQGTSVNVISYAQKYKDKLPDTNSNYTFGIVKNILKNNKEFLNKSNTVENALYGNNLGSTLSYLHLGDYFFKGNGLGTQYIAELYVDFSYVGVVIYNLILGYFLIAIIDVNKLNFVIFAIRLNLIKSILYLPRQFAFGWLTYLISKSTIIILIVTCIIYGIIRRKTNNENSLDS